MKEFYRSKKEGLFLCDKCDEQMRIKAPTLHEAMRELLNKHFWTIKVDCFSKHQEKHYCPHCSIFRRFAGSNQHERLMKGDK